MNNASVKDLLIAIGIPKAKASKMERRSLAELFGQANTVADNTAKDHEDISYAAIPALIAAKELVQRLNMETMKAGDVFKNIETLKTFLQTRMKFHEHEEFICLNLDGLNRLISIGPIFRGSLSQTSVYPREVLRKAMKCNAAAVVLAHNHPSGISAASPADRRLTENLQKVLSLLDVKLLDHFIVAGNEILSFAENGYI